MNNKLALIPVLPAELIEAKAQTYRPRQRLADHCSHCDRPIYFEDRGWVCTNSGDYHPQCAAVLMAAAHLEELGAFANRLARFLASHKPKQLT